MTLQKRGCGKNILETDQKEIIRNIKSKERKKQNFNKMYMRG